MDHSRPFWLTFLGLKEKKGDNPDDGGRNGRGASQKTSISKQIIAILKSVVDGIPMCALITAIYPGLVCYITCDNPEWIFILLLVQPFPLSLGIRPSCLFVAMFSQ